jgi:hypothetical protein
MPSDIGVPAPATPPASPGQTLSVQSAIVPPAHRVEPGHQAKWLWRTL